MSRLRLRLMADGMSAELVDEDGETVAEGSLVPDAEEVAGSLSTGLRFVGQPPERDPGEVSLD